MVLLSLTVEDVPIQFSPSRFRFPIPELEYRYRFRVHTPIQHRAWWLLTARVLIEGFSYDESNLK